MSILTKIRRFYGARQPENVQCQTVARRLSLKHLMKFNPEISL